MPSEPTQPSRPDETEDSINKVLNSVEDLGLTMSDIVAKYGEEGIPFRKDKDYSQRGFLRSTPGPASNTPPISQSGPNLTSRSSSPQHHYALPPVIPDHLLANLRPSDFAISPTPEDSDEEKASGERALGRAGAKASKQQAPPMDESRGTEVIGPPIKPLEDRLRSLRAKASESVADGPSTMKLNRKDSPMQARVKDHFGPSSQLEKERPLPVHIKEGAKDTAGSSSKTPTTGSSIRSALERQIAMRDLEARVAKVEKSRQGSGGGVVPGNRNAAAKSDIKAKKGNMRGTWPDMYLAHAMDWNISGAKIGSEVPVKAHVPDISDDWEVVGPRPGEPLEKDSRPPVRNIKMNPYEYTAPKKR